MTHLARVSKCHSHVVVGRRTILLTCAHIFRFIHKLIIWGIIKHRFLTALNKITFRKSASIINIYICMASSPSPVVVWQYILRIYGHYVPAYPLGLEVGPALPPTALHCLLQPVWKCCRRH